MRANLGSLAVIGLLLIAGCANFQSPAGETVARETTTQPAEITTTGKNTKATTIKTTSIHTSISKKEAKNEAIDAEMSRVNRILNDISNISGTAGAYGEIETTVKDRNTERIRIIVKMPYSYEYNCGQAGAVDGATTKAIYDVTKSSAQLVEIKKNVSTYC